MRQDVEDHLVIEHDVKDGEQRKRLRKTAEVVSADCTDYEKPTRRIWKKSISAPPDPESCMLIVLDPEVEIPAKRPKKQNDDSDVVIGEVTKLDIPPPKLIGSEDSDTPSELVEAEGEPQNEVEE